MKPDKIEIEKLAHLVQESSSSALIYLQSLQDKRQQQRNSAPVEAESHTIKNIYSSVASVGLFMAGAITLVDGSPVISTALTSACLLGLGKAIYHALTSRQITQDARLEKSAEQLIAEDVTASMSTKSLWDLAMVNLGARNDEIKSQARDVIARLRQEPRESTPERMRAA